jgi:hypothetical protein
LKRHFRLRNHEKLAEQLALRKRADAYIGRDGQPPNICDAARAGRRQDLNDDDRRHIRFCLNKLKHAVEGQAVLMDCLVFIEALLERDYDINRMDRLKDEEERRWSGF